jgi:hypothetical protein
LSGDPLIKVPAGMRTNFAPMVGLVKTCSLAARHGAGMNKAARIDIRIIRGKAYFIG